MNPSPLLPRQLQDFADDTPLHTRFHLGHRLGLSAVRIEEIEHDTSSIKEMKYQMLREWQKNQRKNVDQTFTLAKIFDATGIGRVASMIRQNHLARSEQGNVVQYALGRDSDCQEPDNKFYIETSITSQSKALQEEAENRVLTAINNVEKVEFHRKLIDKARKEGRYELRKLKLDSIHLEFAIYSRDGVECLQEDISSGELGRTLTQIFLSEETLKADGEATLTVGVTDQHMFDQALKYFDRMGAYEENMTTWPQKIVMNWAEDVVKLPEEALKKLQEVDGCLLSMYRKEHMKEDLGLSPVLCSKLLRYRDAHLKEQDSVKEYRLCERKMEEWDTDTVKRWLQEVGVPDDVLSLLEDVDGEVLKKTSPTELQEDTGITLLQSRKIVYLREAYLEKIGAPRKDEAKNANTESTSSDIESSDSSSTESDISEPTSPVDDDSLAKSLVSTGIDESGVLSVSYFDEQDTILIDQSATDDIPLTQEEQDQVHRLLSGTEAGFFDSSYFPVLVASGMVEQGDFKQRFNFLSVVNWCAVFDFDPQSNISGLCNFIKTKRPVKKQSLDMFKDVQNIERLRSDLEFPDVAFWLFANGREDLALPAEEGGLQDEHWTHHHLGDEDWVQQRGFFASNSVRFLTSPNVIPRGRERLLFLLMSEEDVFVMSHLFREFAMARPDLNYVVLAANEGVYKKWKDSVLTSKVSSATDMDNRSISHGKLVSINKEIERQIGDIEIAPLKWPLNGDTKIDIPMEKREKWTDLTVTGSNHCQNRAMTKECPRYENFVKEKEEHFYKGNEVDPWNFFLTDAGRNHVLRRDPYSKLYKSIMKLRNEHIQHTNPERIVTEVVTIFHQPGAGGTTLGKHMLWVFRNEFRCITVERLSSSTVDQLIQCVRHDLDDGDQTCPLLVLLDNIEPAALRQLIVDTKRKAQNDGVSGATIVFLHCKRSADILKEGQNKENEPCVYLKHKLSHDERKWCDGKLHELEQSETKMTSVDKLLGFMAMKEECRVDYFDEVVSRMLPKFNKGTSKAINLLKYIAVIQMYVPKFALPVALCDDFMSRAYKRKTLTVAWEKDLPEFLHVLLVEKDKNTVEAKIKSLATVSPILAVAIVKHLESTLCQTKIDMVMELLHSDILLSLAQGRAVLRRSLRELFVHREDSPVGRGKATAFSAFVEQEREENSQATCDLMQAAICKLDNDPYISQHLARLYLVQNEFDMALQSINKALQECDHQFMWDTKGRIFSRRLLQIKDSKKLLDEGEVVELCTLLKNAMEAFKQNQNRNGKVTNESNYGYEGEAHAIFCSLSILETQVTPFATHPNGLKDLSRYLTDAKFIPKRLRLPTEYHTLIKELPVSIDNCVNHLADVLVQTNSKGSVADRSIMESLQRNRYRYFLSPTDSMVGDHQRRVEALELLGGQQYEDIFLRARSKENFENLVQVRDLLSRNESPTLTDLRILTFVSFALTSLQECDLPTGIAEWVQTLTQMEERHNGTYGPFFGLLLEWLLENPQKRTLDKLTYDLRDKWNARYSNEDANIDHGRGFIVRPPKKSSPVEFYLGENKQQRTKCLVHKSIKNNAHLRLHGVLYDKYYLRYQVPGSESIRVRLEGPCNTAPDVEEVTFSLGFTFAGPIACNVLRANTRTPVLIRQEPLKFPAYIKEAWLSCEDSGFESEPISD